VTNRIAADREAGFAESTNEFSHLNRADYGAFLVPGGNNEPVANQNWNEIFSAVFQPRMSDVEVRDFLAKFAAIDMRTSHDKPDSIGTDQQGFVSYYFQRAIDVLIAINAAYVKLVTPKVITYDREGKQETVVLSRLYGQSPSELYFSFCRLNDRDALKPISVDSDTAARLTETFHTAKEFEVNLEDWRYVEQRYGVPYRVFIVFLSLCMSRSAMRLSIPTLKLALLETRGSRIRICAQQANEAGPEVLSNSQTRNEE
jgi:hypothetical protein